MILFKYVIRYTVDFSLEDYAFHLPGGGTITLVDLMHQLGRTDFDESRVADVTFSDESLVRVEKDAEGHWTLQSLQAFTSSEILTIRLLDGSVLTVRVTDAQSEPSTATDLGTFITAVNGEVKKDEQWSSATKYKDGDHAAFTINYTVPSGITGKTLTYDLPAGVVIKKAVPGSPVYDSDGNQIGTYSIGTDGKITINYNEDFHSERNFSGTLTFEGDVKKQTTDTKETISFSGKSEFTVESVQSDLTVLKKGEYDPKEKKIHYKIEVSTEKGTPGTITLTDEIMEGKNWTNVTLSKSNYETESLKIQKISSNGETTIKKSMTTNRKPGFTISGLPRLGAGDKYIIKYDMDVRDLKDRNDSSRVWNEVTGTSIKGTQKVTSSSQSNVSLADNVISKTGKYDPETGKIHWTITLKNLKALEIEGLSLSDHLITTDESGQQYLPNPITINGQSYEIGEDKYTFVLHSNLKEPVTIEYDTDATEATKEDTTFINQVKYGNGDTVEFKSEAVVTPDLGADVDKGDGTVAGTMTAKGTDLQWKAQVRLPKIANYPFDEIAYTDEMSVKSGAETLSGAEYHYTTLAALRAMTVSTVPKEGKSSQTLTPGTDYQIIDQSSGTDVDITDLVKSADETKDAERKITKFKVKFLETDAMKGYLADAIKIALEYQTHACFDKLKTDRDGIFINTGSVPGENKVDEGTYTHPFVIQKQASGKSGSYSHSDPKVTYRDGEKIYYRILLNVPQNQFGEDITLSDTLPAGLHYLDGSVKAYAYRSEKEQMSSVKEFLGGSGTDYDFAASGNVTASTAPNKDDSTLTDLTIQIKSGYGTTGGKPYTIAVYYAVSLQDPAWYDAHTEQKTYTNKVSFGDYTTEMNTTVGYDYKKLEKEAVLHQGEGSRSGSIDYVIVINRRAEKFGDGETITLTDTMGADQNDASAVLRDGSLRLYAYDPRTENHLGTEIPAARYSYTYDAAKRKITLVAPNALAMVLVYTYDVSAGINNAKMSNTVEISGVADAQSKKDTTVSTSRSSATVLQKGITICKVESGNYQLLLPGAQFSLEEYSYDKKAKAGTWTNLKEITTGASGDTLGRVYLSVGNEADLEAGKLYRVKETDPPAGYKTSDKYYYFAVAKEDWDLVTYSIKSRLLTKYISGFSKSGAPAADVQLVTGYGKVFIPNDRDHSITVNKVWVNKDNTDLSGQEPVQVQLYQLGSEGTGEGTDSSSAEPGTKEGGPVTLTADTGWTHTWTGLVEGKYVVRETSQLTGFKTTYSNNDGIQEGTITVTNTSEKKLTNMAFTKRWLDGDKVQTWPENTEIRLRLTAHRNAEATQNTAQNEQGSSSAEQETAQPDLREYVLTVTPGTDDAAPTVSFGENKPDATSAVSCVRDAQGGYLFRVTGLPEGYTYTVKEEGLNGYEVKYYDSYGQLVKDQDSGITDRGVLTNAPVTSQETYSLPATGGPGRGVSAGGLLLALAALWGLGRRLRRG